jgi:hypothetical protein
MGGTPMSYQWLEIRITEEQERRQREAQILDCLPRVLDEVHGAVVLCVEAYVEAFGPQSLEVDYHPPKIRVTVREEQEGKWEKSAKVEITTVGKLPGLHVEGSGEPVDIVVGLLPGGKIAYKDGDEFLTNEELTRRILDRALFPKLAE